jgi:type IV fimbrial biogenesis protein FimT
MIIDVHTGPPNPGRSLAKGFSLLETLLVLSLLGMVVSLAVFPLRRVISSSRLEADLQNLGSALMFARSAAQYSGLTVQVEGLHMRRNLTKNGPRRVTAVQPDSWSQGVLLYANQRGGRWDGYDRREDLRDYRFLSSVRVSSAGTHYQVSSAGFLPGDDPMTFILREPLGPLCATLRLTAVMSRPEICRGTQCPGCRT